MTGWPPAICMRLERGGNAPFDFPAETNTPKGLVSWYTGHHPTVSAAVADLIARNRGFAPLRQTIKDAVWSWGNTPTLGLRTGLIPGICTVSSGT